MAKMNNNGKDDAVALEEIKCIYGLDQLTPWNPQVRKKYDRRFMLRLRFHPLSLKKPDSLLDRNDIKEIVLEECLREKKCSMCECSLKLLEMTPPYDSNAPEMYNAEALQREVVFEILTREILLDQVIKSRRKGDEYKVISSQIFLDMEKCTVMETGKKVPVQTSMSNCGSVA
ncbi:uncharacterized protein [Hetaerina americana]|uniref:uncharacterized protein n=1 Tax=Hetaerina americana TaxID=62018 RepID=UPI003A7F5731